MSKESAIRFLRELGTNEKAQKLLQSKEAPKSKDDIIKAYAEVATELGEELSPEDVAIAVEEIETEIRQKTKDASSDIAELEDEDVEDVAGGDGWCWSDYWCVIFSESPCLGSPESGGSCPRFITD